METTQSLLVATLPSSDKLSLLKQLIHLTPFLHVQQQGHQVIGPFEELQENRSQLFKPTFTMCQWGNFSTSVNMNISTR